MNERSDIDRVLRHWFDDGPSTMPDRVVDVVADRIAHERQRTAWRLPWRPFDMNTKIKIGAAIAAILVIAVVGWSLLPTGTPGIGGPGDRSPTPAPTNSIPLDPTESSSAWWLQATRGPCGDAPVPNGCAGELEAGIQTSGAFQPAITYTVPAGWVNMRDWANYYELFPDTPATRADLDGGSEPGEEIVVVAGGDPFEGCTTRPAVPLGAAEIVGAFAAREGAHATTSVISIGPLSGELVDLSFNPDLPMPCVDASPPPVSPTGGRYRLIVVEAPEVAPIIIRVRASDAAEFDAFLEAAMPIVETFEFDLGPEASPS